MNPRQIAILVRAVGVSILMSNLLGLSTLTQAQPQLDSLTRPGLKRLIAQQTRDTNQVNAMAALARIYGRSRPDTAYQLAQQAYQLAQKLDYLRGQAQGLNIMGAILGNLGDSPKAIRFFNQSAAISRSIGDWANLSKALNNLAAPYADQKNDDAALQALREARAAYQLTIPAGAVPQPTRLSILLTSSLGEAFQTKNQLDSADFYLNRVLPLAQKAAYYDLEANILALLGDGQRKRANTTEALRYYQQALANAKKADDPLYQADIYLRIARLYHQTGQFGASQENARQALTMSQQVGYLPGVLPASELLVKVYEGRDNTQALRYYKIAVAAKDSLYSQEKVKQMLTLSFEEQQRQQELLAAEDAYRNRMWTYGLMATLVGVMGVALLLWRANRRQQRTNRELRATQQQLIQKEKMASLGELTAGIAHEIQNPLNFVNNFSEVSAELIEELTEGPLEHLPDSEKAYAAEIMGDLRQNLTKILHHGQRADGIVKGMLEHSRSSVGERQPTDLNALADEYLKLAYQRLSRSEGLAHASNGSTDQPAVALVTDFDSRLEKMAVVPQDLGRVLLNLYTNAFYAVGEKAKTAPAGYRPTVWVNTERQAKAVVITVKDNGVGMTEAVRQKIFQPFFTTKPTGQGTGLGLSLSYDIITKGYGGSLEAETQVGEGSCLVVRLPL